MSLQKRKRKYADPRKESVTEAASEKKKHRSEERESDARREEVVDGGLRGGRLKVMRKRESGC